MYQRCIAGLRYYYVVSSLLSFADIAALRQNGTTFSILNTAGETKL